MSNPVGRLWAAAFLPIVVAAVAPTGAQAYNEWQMEHDQAAVNQLSQEGILTAPQAMYLDQTMSNRRMQSWMNGQGLSNNSIATPYGMVPVPPTAQARAENRQIDKLQRDHFITWQEANGLKDQVKAQSLLMPQASVSGQIVGSGGILTNAPMITNGTIMGSSPMVIGGPMMSPVISPLVGTSNPMINSSPLMPVGSPLPSLYTPAGYYGSAIANPASMPTVGGPTMLQRLRGILMY